MWITSRKWKKNELDGQTVEFRIIFPTWRTEGVGRFMVQGNGVQKMAIAIVVPHDEKGFDKAFDQVYRLTDERVEKIELNPDKAKGRFRLLE